ncbi:right-handed parallel beta-helix repeat-containing protein [Phycisphaera mikurensis]|uniref:Uncharacterized protein n=1 Tax=Phycisphaera mikurensis (strain NBRC 102666 / KCTC 22515 / FYK2301M01) TaxID=1142394 RepID=I0IAI4_PHYMF|nr:right-handed parallel beta-helix repeat-containing protein [Phycisphaera mikurensis]MBB6441731.1 hypothetical protein [Phycisphaera mikurensis]BAM02272.1 hypothetical protein PSMK_01130 [Phycisphaera mikurensis NBRC 102666]
MRTRLAFFCTLALLLLPAAASAELGPAELGYDIAETGLGGRTFVVSPDGDDRHPGTEDRPMRTPQAAADRVEPGDTVLLRAGEYTNDGPAPVIEIARGGNRRAWVRFASFPGETAVIRFDGLRGIRVADAAYVLIEGLEIVGVAAELDPAAALAHALAFEGDDYGEHRYFGVGIRLGDGPDENPHHVILRNNRIRDAPGSGIATARSDSVLVQGNEVSGCGFYSPWGESGISMWRSVDANGDRRSYKMVVRDNVLRGNDNRVPFWIMEAYSDGNGIILDANERTPGAGSAGYPGYRGRFLVVNNVCSGNGGRGVNVFETANADVLHNTLVGNATRENIGSEVELGRTDRVRVRNNVIVPLPGKKPVGGYSTERADIGANLVSGGGEADFELDPAASGDPGFAATAGADAFRLAPGSPAIGAGDPDASFPVDAAGVPREPGVPPDLGAYAAAAAR